MMSYVSDNELVFAFRTLLMQLTSHLAPISQTLVQAFRVLEAFKASEPALTLGQVAYRAGLDIGTAFHLIQTLVMLGYIERIPGSKQFRLTLKPLELGFHAILLNLETFSSRYGIDYGPGYLNKCSLSELHKNRRSLPEPPDKPS
jgi:DNA-binding MarR family transcriptional regulator